MTLRWTAAEPGLPAIPDSRYRPSGELAAVHGRARALPGPGLEFRLCRRGREHRISRGRANCRSRHGYAGDVPVDGASGDFEWDGYIPFDELPSSYNPPSGMIVTANQNPFPADYPYPVNGNFAPPQRLLQIRNLLSARKGWRPRT